MGAAWPPPPPRAAGLTTRNAGYSVNQYGPLAVHVPGKNAYRLTTPKDEATRIAKEVGGEPVWAACGCCL